MTANANANANANDPPEPANLDADLDAGLPTADINAVGAQSRRLPVKIVALVLMGLLLVIGLVFGLKHWAGKQFSQQTAVTKKEPPPAPPPASSARAHLPDENTPLAPTGATDTPEWSSPAYSPAYSPVQPANGNPSASATAGNNPATSSTTAPAPGAATATGAATGPATRTAAGGAAACAVTKLIDKNTGIAVRDSRGQPLMVDCKGMVQGQTVPAVQPGAYSPVVTTTAAGTTGAAPPPPVDRYAGDSSLSPPSRKSGLAAAGAAVGGAVTGQSPTSSTNSLLSEYLKTLTNQRQAGAGAGTVAGAGAGGAANLAAGGNQTQGTGGNPQGAIGGLLTPTATPKAMAARTLDENLTIPKGNAIDCAMTTRVVTEVSGFTSCIVSNNVYSANGRILLIERMSEVQGEYTAVGQPGQRRVYVLWSRIRKPGGITIDIASPSTDALGAAGIDGMVDNRYFERIGSAYMLSIFKDFLITAQVNSGSNSAGNSYQNTANTSNSIAEKVLSSSINIKPTIYANQGARVAIYVARDLDFSPVYAVTTQQ